MKDLLGGKDKLVLPEPKFADVGDFIEEQVCPALREALRHDNVPIIEKNMLTRGYVWQHIAGNYAIYAHEQHLPEERLVALIESRRRLTLIDILKLLEGVFVSLPDQAIVACRGNWLKQTEARAIGHTALFLYIDFTFALVPTEVARKLALLRN